MVSPSTIPMSFGCTGSALAVEAKHEKMRTNNSAASFIVPEYHKRFREHATFAGPHLRLSHAAMAPFGNRSSPRKRE
jgi:hypothetical protein